MQIHRAPIGRPLRLLVSLLALLLLAAPGLATWSIIVVNTKTGEVAVGTATCLTGTNIQNIVPVLVPGLGGGASQSLIDSGGINRKIIWDGLHNGDTPDEILLQLSAINGFQARQFGVVNFPDNPVTFTGNNAGQAKGGVAGVVGDLRYAIQGNVLTDPIVWLAAEQAILNAPGDLSQKLMAAMEAARSYGGDGRCSCSPTAPTSCGAPPAMGFTKSAHCGYVGVGRIGDDEGVCNSVIGCANGDYFLSLNFVGATPDPDPVIVLQGMYDAWRLGLVGVPDQLHSLVAPAFDSIVADGHSTQRVDLKLVDIEGTPLTSGGAAITFEHLSAGAPLCTPIAALDKGNGSYSFELQAGLQAGSDLWRVRADGVVLQPDVLVRIDALTPLHIGFDTISSAAGAPVPLTLNLGGANAGEPYQLLASAAGSVPGTTLGGLAIPLNPDHLYLLSLNKPAGNLFVNTIGRLDADGRAQAGFRVVPGMLDAFVGGQIDWAVLLRTAQPAVFGPVAFGVAP